MDEKSRKPKIRFAGFTEDWEQRKLGELASAFEYGLNAAAKIFDGKNKYIRITDIDDTTRAFLQSDLTSPDVNFVLAEKFKLREGDIVFARTGASVGKTYIYNKIDGLVYFAGFLIRVRIKPEHNTDFVFQNTLTKKYATFINVTSQRSGQPGVNAQEYASFEFLIPTHAEQTKIGTFFRHLDHLITLHQRKRERLVNIKKAMLEKMFPKKGADVPEVRFAGFTEAWEQRKVGEYYDFKNGLNKGKEYFSSGTPIVNFTDVFHHRGIYGKDLKGKVNLTKPEIENFRVRGGDIFFTRTSETIDEIGFPSVMLDDPENTVFSGFVLRGRALQDDPLTLRFKRYAFFTDAFRKEMVKKSSMTTRALTSGTAIKNMEFIFPKDKQEQEVVGIFFVHLDHLITLHQRKVELLQNIKKACLEMMFV